jgi:hypothetical protein
METEIIIKYNKTKKGKNIKCGVNIALDDLLVDTVNAIESSILVLKQLSKKCKSKKELNTITIGELYKINNVEVKENIK